MRTIHGRVRPFGTGTKPLDVRIEWPESFEEAEEYDGLTGDAEQGLMILGAKKGIILVQDAVRSDESWEGQEPPPEEDEKAWAALQKQVDDMVKGMVIDPGKYPGEKGKKRASALTKAKQDPEAAQALIEELKARHGL